MNEVLRFLLWPFMYLILREVKRSLKHIEKNINRAPNCCGESMEYLGEHQGFYSNTQFYQCGICKRLEILYNQ